MWWHLSFTSRGYTTVGKPGVKFSNWSTVLRWGLLSQFPPFRNFPNFSALSKHTSDIECHVYILQMSPWLSCGDTCHIRMWFKESNRYFCKIEKFAYGEINERNFSNPHPWYGITANLPHIHHSQYERYHINFRGLENWTHRSWGKHIHMRNSD